MTPGLLAALSKSKAVFMSILSPTRSWPILIMPVGRPYMSTALTAWRMSGSIFRPAKFSVGGDSEVVFLLRRTEDSEDESWLELSAEREEMSDRGCCCNVWGAEAGSWSRKDFDGVLGL